MPGSDARFCADITFRNARTFALASRFLPAEKRRGAFALYAMCRTADDIVDRAVPGEPPAALQAELLAFRSAVTSALAGAPEGPLLRELCWTGERFAVPRRAIEDLLDGVARDIEGCEYQTWGDLQTYCEGVASSVGEMCVSVFGVTRPEQNFDPAVRAARQLGIAMQLTNILRDVGEDASRGRCYLPTSELAEFGFRPEDVVRRIPLERRGAWEDAMRAQVARARGLYREAMPAVSLLSPDAQQCALACAVGYSRILDAIERNGYDNLSRRAIVAWPERARVFFDAWRLRAPASLRHPGDAAVA